MPTIFFGIPQWDKDVRTRDNEAQDLIRFNWQLGNASCGFIPDFKLLTRRELLGPNGITILVHSLFAENSHGQLAAEQGVRTAEQRFAVGGLTMIIRLENCRGGKRAFTLVEVVVATLVVSILFIALFTGLSQGFALSAAATETLRANQILLERIEGIRLVKWSDLNNTALVPTSFTASYYPLTGNGESQGVTYNGTVTIADAGIGTSYNDSMRKLTVTVNWVSGKITRAETMSTFVSRMGLQNYVYYN